MALLKKIRSFNRVFLTLKFVKVKGATLIESLVASVIIVVIFAIASLTLNNVFEAAVKNNTSRVDHRMNELNYLYLNNKITSPYQEDFEDWNIQLVHINELQGATVRLEATRAATKKSISKRLMYVESKE